MRINNPVIGDGTVLVCIEDIVLHHIIYGADPAPGGEIDSSLKPGIGGKVSIVIIIVVINMIVIRVIYSRLVADDLHASAAVMVEEVETENVVWGS